MGTEKGLSTELERLKLESIKNGAPLFDAFIGKAISGMVVDLEDGTILRATPQMNILFGYEPGDLFMKNIDILIPERLREVHGNHFKNYNNQPRQMGHGGMTLLGVKKDGTEFNIEISLYPGEVIGRKVVAAIIMQSRNKQSSL